MAQPPNIASDESTGVSKLKEKSLKAAGYAYLVGDAALFAAGLMEKNIKGASVGLLWGLGGLAAARYGNPAKEKQLELLTHRLGDYLEKQGVKIPDIAECKMLTEKESVLYHIEEFLYSHPSEALNAVYAVGAAQMVGSGIAQKFTPDISSGALIGAGALAGLLIPERKPDASHPAHGALGKAMQWVQEKPLRVSGALYTINNASMLWAGIAKRRQNPAQKSYMLRFATAASYIFANSMLAMSSKGGSGGDKKADDVLQSLADTSARVIIAQPQELQEALVEHVSAFLSSQPEVNKKAPEIAEILHKKLAEVKATQQPAQGVAEAAKAPPESWAGHIAAEKAALPAVAPSL